MAVENSTRLQFPTHEGKLLYSARVGWARVLAAQAAKKDWERLTTAFQDLQEGDSSDGFASLPISSLLGVKGPQLLSKERPDVLEPPSEALHGLLGAEEPSAADTVPNIGIIGAGAAGLFTAMVLKWLKANAVDADSKPFNYTCDIIEASSIAGGRLNTHSFSDTQQDLYFDVGAMRYPQNDVMTRCALSYLLLFR
jgi:NAD(P)-binding Rossmann-like domain